jgi:hypothetical protein
MVKAPRHLVTLRVKFASEGGPPLTAIPNVWQCRKAKSVVESQNPGQKGETLRTLLVGTDPLFERDRET